MTSLPEHTAIFLPALSYTEAVLFCSSLSILLMRTCLFWLFQRHCEIAPWKFVGLFLEVFFVGTHVSFDSFIVLPEVVFFCGSLLGKGTVELRWESPWISFWGLFFHMHDSFDSLIVPQVRRSSSLLWFSFGGLICAYVCLFRLNYRKSSSLLWFFAEGCFWCTNLSFKSFVVSQVRQILIGDFHNALWII